MAGTSIKQYVFRKGAANRIPVSGTFELTPRCNLNCKMCYVHMSAEEMSSAGRELTTEEWLKLGRDAVDAGMIYLLITGGEPFIRPDFIELYTSLMQMGLLISINTNATLLTPEILECFIKYRPEKVNVTLYGMSDLTYGALCGNSKGFESAVHNIRMMKEAGIRVNINTTFTRYNIGDMEAIVAFAKEEKIPVRMSGYIFPPVRNQHTPDNMNLTPEEMGNASALFDLMTMDKDRRMRRKEYILKCLNGTPADIEKPESKISSCMAGRGAFWITWDGKMYPCGMLPNYVQDIRCSSFSDAWRKTVESVTTMLLPPECSVCKYQPLCPTCAAVSLCTHGVTNVLDPQMCIRTKVYIDSFLNQIQ